MRSEAEIRHEVETRLRRRGLLLLNGGLWAAMVFYLTFVRPAGSFLPGSGLIPLSLLLWTLLLAFHAFRVIYVELRERLVRGAIEREHQYYLLRDHYEKRKRSEDRERSEAARVHISDDGELIDTPHEEKVKADYER